MEVAIFGSARSCSEQGREASADLEVVISHAALLLGIRGRPGGTTFVIQSSSASDVDDHK
jgi:hypothetical protein